MAKLLMKKKSERKIYLEPKRMFYRKEKLKEAKPAANTKSRKGTLILVILILSLASIGYFTIINFDDLYEVLSKL